MGRNSVTPWTIPRMNDSIGFNGPLSSFPGSDYPPLSTCYSPSPSVLLVP